MCGEKNFFRLDHPFPVGGEYYRAPTPKGECWDEDFSRLHKTRFKMVCSLSYWNWMEPFTGPAYPQGAMIHCYDHPAWREYGRGLLRHSLHKKI